ncbi:MAG: sensor histidine kinase [Rariglobus sp.]
MAELSDYLAGRREDILQAWRRAISADEALTTASSLTRSQLNDHIPEILDAFERRLRANQLDRAEEGSTPDEKVDEAKHGVTRWQQGYRFQELMQEWGHLQLCLLEELNTFGAIHPDFDRATLADASRELVAMVNGAIAESAAQYEHMQQVEAASHIDELMAALTSVLEVERRRSTLIHQAVHDLGNNFNSVGMTAHLLGDKQIADDERQEFATILQQSVHSVSSMLGELTELARLEAGQERREIRSFDAAALVTDLCDINRAFARDRNLFLKLDPLPSLQVEGDPGKARRLLQNLLRNGLKYTEHGGVSVSCTSDDVSWSVMIADTGPGLYPDKDSPLVAEMKKATAIVLEAEGKAESSNAASGGTSGAFSPVKAVSSIKRSAKQSAGEGIGLSIVKRLCDLLDASLEVTSPPGSGTTFRVVFPRRY